MKNLTYFFLLIPILSLGQPSSTFDDFRKFLLKGHYIAPSDTNQLSQDSLIESLHYLFDQRRDHFYIEGRGMISLRIPILDNKRKERAKRLIDGLFMYRIIEEQVHEDLKFRLLIKEGDTALRNQKINDEIDVLQYLYERNKYKSQEQVMAVNESLKKYVAYNLLPKQYLDSPKINSKQSLIKAFNNSTIIDLANLPDSLELAYEYLFNQLKRLNPILEIQNFRYSIAKEQIKNTNLSYPIAKVRFECTGNSYTSHQFIDEFQREENSCNKIDNSFFWIFNKILADNELPKRIV